MLTAPLALWPATLPLKLEITFGSTTVDVFPDVLKQEIRITYGAPNESGSVVAASIAFELDNPDSHYTPDHPMGDYYPYVQLGVEVKAWVYWAGEWWLRFDGQASEWRPFWPYGDLSDIDRDKKGEARVTVVASGLLRQLAQGKAPLRSPLFRSLAGIAEGDYVPHEYLPMEDGTDSTQIASGLAGRPAVTPTGPAIEFAADGPSGSAPLLRASAGTQIVVPITSYTDVGKWTMSLAVNIPVEPAAATTLLEVPVTGGTMAYWRLEFVPGTPAEIRWAAYSSAGVRLFYAFEQLAGSSAVPSEAEFFGEWYLITVGSEQDGTDLLAWLGYSNGATPGNPFAQMGNNSEPTTTHGALTDRAVINVDSSLDGIGLGHWALFVDANFDPFLDGLAHCRALIGWSNEQAHDRIERLCRELGVSVSIVGSTSERMGPQQIDTFYNLIAAAAQVDLGILHEDLIGLRLVYRCRNTLYDQDPAFALNARLNQIANILPTLDDLNVRNDVTIQRINGSEYRSVVETGPKSIQPTPNGVGVYDEKLTLNLYADEQARHNATWRTWRGAWPGMRYPRISPDINASPDIAEDWLAVTLGDLVRVTDLPPQHPISAVDVLVRGWTETLRPTSWDVTVNGAPAGPYRVGQAGDGSNASSWLQCGAATALTSTLIVGATSVTITPDGDLFSTTANLTLNPLELIVGGEVLPVVSISGAGPTQTFVVTRTLPKRHLAGAIVQVNNPLIAAL